MCFLSKLSPLSLLSLLCHSCPFCQYCHFSLSTDTSACQYCLFCDCCLFLHSHHSSLFTASVLSVLSCFFSHYGLFLYCIATYSDTSVAWLSLRVPTSKIISGPCIEMTKAIGYKARTQNDKFDHTTHLIPHSELCTVYFFALKQVGKSMMLSFVTFHYSVCYHFVILSFSAAGCVSTVSSLSPLNITYYCCDYHIICFCCTLLAHLLLLLFFHTQ